MITKTRRKLIFLYWGTSALLFTSILAVLIFMNYKKAQEGESYFFDNKVNVVAQQIAFTRDLSSDFFAHMEENYQIYVYSLTNRTWYGVTRNMSEQNRLKNALDALNLQLKKQPASYTGYLPFDLECTSSDLLSVPSFYGKKLEIETIRHDTDVVYILYDVNKKFLSPKELWFYLLLEGLGLMLLFLLSRFFVFLATRPIERGIQQQTEFIASASHELKSPVAVIQLNAQTIKTVDRETGLRLLETIIDECRHLSSMIQNMLLLASGDAKRLPFHPKSLETDHFFIKIYERYDTYCRQKGHPLSLTFDETLPPVVFADQALLTQVLEILIDNAVSYSLPDTPISLSVKNTRKSIKVSVENIAPSITGEQQERLFQRFYRADSSAASGHCGLGLSIAKEIVEYHGGTICLESCAKDHFVFSFQIPI